MPEELGLYVLYLGNDKIELDLDNMVPIGDDLSVEFTQQPSLYAYIATLAARAEAEWGDAKNALARMGAQTDKEVRRDLAMSNEKVTEGKVEAEVELRRGYQEAADFELECREQYLVMRALTRTFDMRAQMLISLGAHLRAESEQTGMLVAETKARLNDIAKRKRKNGEYKPPF